MSQKQLVFLEAYCLSREVFEKQNTILLKVSTPKSIASLTIYQILIVSRFLLTFNRHTTMK